MCKPCQELYDNGYIDTTKPMILGNVLGSVRFSNYLPEEEVGEIMGLGLVAKSKSFATKKFQRMTKINNTD